MYTLTATCYIIIVSIGVIFTISMISVIIGEWWTHIDMTNLYREGTCGRSIWAPFSLFKLKYSHYTWYKYPNFKHSLFVDYVPNTNIHAGIFVFNNVYLKMNIITYYRAKAFVKKEYHKTYTKEYKL